MRCAMRRDAISCALISVILCLRSFLAGNTPSLLPGLLCRAIRPLPLVTRSSPSAFTCALILAIFGRVFGVWKRILLSPGGSRLARCLFQSVPGTGTSRCAGRSPHGCRLAETCSTRTTPTSARRCAGRRLGKDGTDALHLDFAELSALATRPAPVAGRMDSGAVGSSQAAAAAPLRGRWLSTSTACPKKGSVSFRLDCRRPGAVSSVSGGPSWGSCSAVSAALPQLQLRSAAGGRR